MATPSFQDNVIKLNKCLKYIDIHVLYNITLFICDLYSVEYNKEIFNEEVERLKKLTSFEDDNVANSLNIILLVQYYKPLTGKI
jgi:hypothetical protein